MAAFGILLVAVAVHVITLRPALLQWGVGVGTLFAFGRFFASNLMLHSDYIVLIGTAFALASLTPLLFALNAHHAGRVGDGCDPKASQSIPKL